MNRGVFINIVRFVLLVLVQVLIFNRLNFFGYINPMIYIMFLYWYPIKQNRALFIGVCFLLGLSIDFFSDTLAMHTAATTTIAYARSTVMRFVFGINYEFQSFKLSNTTRVQQFTFLALLLLMHHMVFFSLEIFSFSNVMLIVKKVLSFGAASLILCLLFISLFSSNRT